MQVAPPEAPLDLEEVQRRPRVHRGIHVAEVPLVCRDLPVRVGVQAPEHQGELFLGEVEVDQGQRHRVKRQVPGRVPRVLPLVGHRDEIAVEHVEPLGVPDGLCAAPEQRMCVVLVEPAIDVEQVVLLGPQHPGERLPMDPPLVLGEGPGGNPVVELVGIGDPRREAVVELLPEGDAGERGREAHTNHPELAGRNVEDVPGRRFGAGLRGIDRAGVAFDDVPVKRILDVRGGIGLTPQALGVGLVLREQ